MITDKMVQSLNTQMNREYFSSLFYLSMAAYAENIGFKGAAKWFKIQYHEENFHAMKFYEFLQSRGGKIEFLDIEKPNQNFTSIQDLFMKTLKHEENVTELIDELMNVAISEKDHASQIFLQWYITEQVEDAAVGAKRGEEVIEHARCLLPCCRAPAAHRQPSSWRCPGIP